ncbi:hypothetical protein JCM24511_03707 [Saitozyma sp. JCM 24511]|nr:hypothetical protein JCM24511_03707 [Saitozyma sp. JCM 24511]
MRFLLVALFAASSALALVQPRSGCSTNSECLKRGLPPIKPRARRGQNHVARSPSTFSGYFYNSGADPYQSSQLVSSQWYATLQTTSTNALVVSVNYDSAVTTPQSGLNVKIVSPTTTYKYLALSPYDPSDGSSVSPTSEFYLKLVGASDPSDSTQQPPVNNIDNTKGNAAYIETAVCCVDNALQRLSGSEHDDDELYVRHAVSDKPGWRVTARARASESGAEEHEHKAYSYSPSAEIYASNPYSASGPKRTGLTNPADGPYPVGSAALFKTKVSNSYNAGSHLKYGIRDIMRRVARTLGFSGAVTIR